MTLMLTYALFATTFACLLLWFIDQLFFFNHEKFANKQQSVFIKLVYQILPYLLILSVILLFFSIRQGIDFDFNYILVPLTLLFFVLIIADKVYYKDRKQRGKGKERVLINSAYDFLPILAFVLIMRSFVIEPFNIPSSSMVPTLYTGDFIAVNKHAYGVRLPLTHSKVLNTGAPERGDVAVFRFPANPHIYYIKRVIGLPGDTISYAEGILSINGAPVPTQTIEYTANADMVAQMYPAGPQENGRILSVEDAALRGKLEEDKAMYLQESIGEHEFYKRYLPLTMETAVHSPLLNDVVSKSNPWSISVPEGHYFVMGDNRDRSLDGRFWGFVPDENLAGKAVYRWMHKAQGMKLPTFKYNGAIQ